MGNQNENAQIQDKTSVEFTKFVSTKEREFWIRPRNGIETNEKYKNC
jgi:hypothetical protein